MGVFTEQSGVSDEESMWDVVSSMIDLIATVQRKCPGGVFYGERLCFLTRHKLGRARRSLNLSVGSQS
jgi:hypothetical protein